MPEATNAYTTRQAVITLDGPLQCEIDAWRSHQNKLPTRAEAIRHLIRAGLRGELPHIHAKGEQDAIDLSMRGPHKIHRETVHIEDGQWTTLYGLMKDVRYTSLSQVMFHVLELGIAAIQSRPPEPAPLLLPPPAPKPRTLTELAALIRETAETNPFVRPLADLLEGKV